MKHYHPVSRVAIYLLAVVLILFGILYFVNARDMMVYIPYSLPGGILWAYLVGAAFVLVGVSFITNRMVKFSGYLLAILLFIFVFIIHLPNSLDAGTREMRSMALINLLKDTAIAGFAMHIAAGAHHQQLHLEEESD